ncbi:nucleoside-diphosphate kinase [Rhizohabitans arisaemae]|uniref:nucleoside-diphosphate kinase n=1 Tax=Rhizohabitans arisaemae TaxID=2720610 RepID=UPI0024B132C3|nr:nucleoside-diphosphate kinase [Rhizohabitans arisaemae]
MMQESGKSWTYVLMTPDALVTDSLSWIMERLRSADFVPVAGALLRVDSATMLSIYDTPPRRNQRARPPRRAFDLWYGLGPAYVLLLQYDKPDACTALLKVKGATDPNAAQADSIRYAGENVLMNLVHCPDDEISAIDELTKLLGESRAVNLRQLVIAPSGRVQYLTVDTLDDALPVRSGGTALSVPLIVNGIRLRIAQHLAISGFSSDSALSLLAEARSALRRERDEMARAAVGSGRFDVARAHAGPLHDLLHRVARQVGEPVLGEALVELSAFTSSKGDWAATKEALNAGSVYVSEVESAVLEMSTYL